MNDDLFTRFNFPVRGESEAFWESQKLLGKIDSRFNQYFSKIIYNASFSSAAPPPEKGVFVSSETFNKILTTFFEKFLIFVKKEVPIQCDILINPSFCTFSRVSEQKLVLKLIESCTSLDLTVGVICNYQIEEILSQEIDKHLSQEIDKQIITTKVIFLNPISALSWFQKKIVRLLARKIAQADFREISNILARNGINIKSHVRNTIELSVFNEFAWLCLQKNLNFQTVILRCELDQFSASITKSAKSKGIPVICFQHGVISHTLDVPIRVNRFLTFGKQSAGLLKKINNQFSMATNQTDLCSEFYPVGSITDAINLQDNNFSKRSILIIDQYVDRARRFNGLNKLLEELDRLIKALLSLDSVEKIVIRPHPESEFCDFWELCTMKYSNKFNISHPRLSLEVDIHRNSIAVGLFSGALVVAAASGLPSYFLTSHNAYFTPDLDCFKSYFVLPFDSLIKKIQKLTTDEAFYLNERENCLRKSSMYYEDNRQISIDREFVQTYILSA